MPIASPDETRRRIYRTVKGGVAAGSLSLAGVLALAIPWANAQSSALAEVKTNLAVVQVGLDECHATISRVSTIEAAQAGSLVAIQQLGQRLDRIETKLDRALERMK